MLALSLFLLALVFALQPILAQHKSRCGVCDHLIVEDEEIVEEDGQWIHADCSAEGFEALDATLSDEGWSE